MANLVGLHFLDFVLKRGVVQFFNFGEFLRHEVPVADVHHGKRCESQAVILDAGHFGHGAKLGGDGWSPPNEESSGARNEQHNGQGNEAAGHWGSIGQLSPMVKEKEI